MTEDSVQAFSFQHRRCAMKASLAKTGNFDRKGMQPLCAHSWLEAKLYLMATPCPNCSRGPCEPVEESLGSSPGRSSDPGVRAVIARCAHCGDERELAFGLPVGMSPGSAAEVVNPTSAPSEVLDAGQWISLHYLLTDAAQRAAEKFERRRLMSLAGQCLDEALRFYVDPDDELPPQSALFTNSSRRAFTEHPEKFARQKLRDIRARLPGPPRPAPLTQPHPPAASRSWWRFWA
jgi:hypothetical protein